MTVVAACKNFVIVTKKFAIHQSTQFCLPGFWSKLSQAVKDIFIHGHQKIQESYFYEET